MTNLSDMARKNWPILAVIGTGLIAWGANTTMLVYANEATQDNAADIAEIQKEISSIRESAAAVRTAAEAQRAATAESQRVTERQIDQLIRLMEQIRNEQ